MKLKCFMTKDDNDVLDDRSLSSFTMTYTKDQLMPLQKADMSELLNLQ